MSDTPENFDQLRKAMKLATYEVPPPGYFNNFSTRVISRIERDKSRSGAKAQEGQGLMKFLRLLETNPLAAAAFGFSVCGILVAGIAYSEYQEPSETAAASVLNNSDTASDTSSGKLPGTLASVTAGDAPLTTSFKPALETSNLASGLFDNFNSLSVKQVNFSGNH